MLKQKSRPAETGQPAENQQYFAEQFADFSDGIIPEMPRNRNLKQSLDRAAADSNWRLWWRIYARAHDLAWPPTGRDVKRALSRGGNNG